MYHRDYGIITHGDHCGGMNLHEGYFFDVNIEQDFITDPPYYKSDGIKINVSNQECNVAPFSKILCRNFVGGEAKRLSHIGSGSTDNI